MFARGGLRQGGRHGGLPPAGGAGAQQRLQGPSDRGPGGRQQRAALGPLRDIPQVGDGRIIIIIMVLETDRQQSSGAIMHIFRSNALIFPDFGYF